MGAYLAAAGHQRSRAHQWRAKQADPIRTNAGFVVVAAYLISRFELGRKVRFGLASVSTCLKRVMMAEL